jgi:hypothetical protein
MNSAQTTWRQILFPSYPRRESKVNQNKVRIRRSRVPEKQIRRLDIAMDNVQVVQKRDGRSQCCYDNRSIAFRKVSFERDMVEKLSSCVDRFTSTEPTFESKEPQITSHQLKHQIIL